MVLDWVTIYVKNPNRPPSGGWMTYSDTSMPRRVPIKVSGSRIAVMDGLGKIEALRVSYYDSLDGKVLAVASQASYVITVAPDSSGVTATQANIRYAANLEGKKVVGITRAEMSTLLRLAMLPHPQNL